MCACCFHDAGIPELVKLIKERGAVVYLISGGFRDIINPIADTLNISRECVIANTLLFKVQNV